LRSLALLATLLGLTLVAPSAPAGATTKIVSVTNYAFTPASVTVVLGGAVSWQFHAEHTTTSRQGFWNSGHRMSGSFTYIFVDAGTFAYYCTMHSSMTGQVAVPLTATGTPTTGWTVRWSSRSSTPASIRFDLQYRRVGTTAWVNSRVSTASRSTKFNPARSASYQLRARTRIGSKVSGWSPVRTVKIS
jgi:plastocyanin